MPKINELPRANTLAATDLLAKDNPSGTSTEGVSVSQIADYVKTTFPSIDDTLTLESHPADAKAVGDAFTDVDDEIQDTRNIINATAETKTTKGPIVNFLDGAGGTEPIKLVVKMLPNQSGSGTPSSGNVRPFTARTQQSICISPRNICRIRSTSSTVSGITVTPNGDGTVNFSGKSTASSAGGPICAYAYLHEGVKYYCVFDYSSGTYYPRLDGPNGERVFPTSGQTFTAASSGEYSLRLLVNNGKTYNKSNVIPYVCLANSSHTKIPATGSLRALTFPEEINTVYAGIMTYEHGGKYTIQAYPYYASYNGETLSGEWVSSKDEYSPGATPTIGAEVIDMSGVIANTYTFDSVKTTIFEGENVVDGNPKLCDIQYIIYVVNTVLSADSSYDIPSYYRMNNYIDDKISDVRSAILESNGNYDSFVFITDVHWGMNAKNSPALIKYILDRLPIPRVFFGGDLGEGINLTCLHAYREKISARIYNAIGNHEYHNYYYDIDKPSKSMTMKDPYLWAYFNSGMTDAVVGNAGRNYYYVDNTVQKIRYIILNVYAEGTTETFESDQQTWLANTALDLPNGYTAVIIGHQIAYVNHDTGALSFSYGAGGTAIRDIVDAASGTTEIACVICGHTHFDGIGTTPGGTPVIVTTCDKYKASETTTPGVYYDGWLIEKRAEGTITEQAFDIYVLDKTNKKITAVRIGCPADNPTDNPLETRTITYGTV